MLVNDLLFDRITKSALIVNLKNLLQFVLTLPLHLLKIARDQY